MDKLDSFETELACHIGKPTELRPFVCDGSPLACQAFIVGYNPATNMEADFWHFWSQSTGFDKSAWRDEYVADRNHRPLSPGRTRRTKVSPSRRVIEWILEEAAPVKVLETNIYATPTRRKRELAPEDHDDTPFRFLVSTIKPSVIVVHGNDAISKLRLLERGHATVIERRHFSRGWSQAAARELGRQMKEICSRSS
jgi:hypothetical protein